MQWMAVAREVYKESVDDNVNGQAAKVAYYVFAALFPFILSLLALTGIAGGETAFQWIMGHLRDLMPADASRLLEQFVYGITHQKRPGLLSIGVVLTLWSSSNIFSSLGDALNIAYDVKETRSWLKRKAVALGLVAAATVLLVGGAVILIGGPSIGNVLHLGLIWTMISIPLPFVLLLGMLWLTYYALPNRDQRHSKQEVLCGAIAGATLWLLITLLFRVYVSHFGNYDRAYGVLGSVIVLQLWLYLTALAMLIGGELASVLEKHASDDKSDQLRFAA
jgi:membrane protein